MTNIVEAITTAVRPYSTYILVAILVLIFGVVGYYGYNKYAKPMIKTDDTKDVANANRRNKSADIYFFHVDWCPHCHAAADPWKSFSDEYDGREVNGVRLKCHAINCTDETPEITEYMATYNIESYPTVKMVLGDGTVVEFDAKIEKNSLAEFLNTVLTDK
jgi:thiol-disulfide isomerase/thioredoxin